MHVDQGLRLEGLINKLIVLFIYLIKMFKFNGNMARNLTISSAMMQP